MVFHLFHTKNSLKKLLVHKSITLKYTMPAKALLPGRNVPDDDGMLLFTEHGIFYEFMPVEEYGKKITKNSGLE